MAKTDREALVETRAQLEEAAAVLERLAKAPLKHGTVIKVGKRLTVAGSGGDLSDMEVCQFELKAGDGVLIDPQGGQILEKTESLPIGEPVTILRVVDKNRAEISVNGSNRVIYTGQLTVKEADEVLLDRSGLVAVHAVKFAKPRFAVAKETGVVWEDIGGQVEAKAALRDAVELPFKSPELFKGYGKRPPKGVLLSGPPGCGKTMLGKAAATAIQKLTGGSQSGFLYIKGPEVLDPYVGVSEAAVRKIFLRAKEHKANTGSPALVFVDEADAILGRRGTHHSFMEKTIVPAFLTEMDGMEESGAMVILATNRPDTLDPAVIRDGRIDRKVMVTRPSQKDAAAIFKIYLKNLPLERGVDVAEMAEAAADSLFSPERVLLHLTMKTREDKVFPLHGLVSGAMIEGIVDKAVSLALSRDVKNGARKPSGVTVRDIHTGIVMTHRENIHVDHSDAILDFTHGHEVMLKRKAIAPELEQAA